jgi:hypothetical protein
MPRIIKYKINYEQKGGMNLGEVATYLKEIKDIYDLVNSVAPNQVVLTGSGAILYYLYHLGRMDLIQNYKAPSDVDLVLMNIHKIRNFSLDGLSFSNFEKISGDDISNTYMMQNKQGKTLISFDLTKLIGSTIRHNVINGMKIIDLEKLESFYIDPDELAFRSPDKVPEDLKKVEIIREIKERVKEIFPTIEYRAQLPIRRHDDSPQPSSFVAPASSFNSPARPASSFNSPFASGPAAPAFNSPFASSLNSPDAKQPKPKFAKKLF